MQVRPIVVGDFQVNCYVLWSEARQALVIDPGDDSESVIEVIERERLTVVAFLITHGHLDHVAALTALVKRYPAPIAMHPKDAAWAFTAANTLPPYGAPTDPGAIKRQLSDGQNFEDGGLRYQVIATPGHSPGGVCYYFPDAGMVFTGDTLFAGSVGRTDFRGGDEALLHASLGRLLRLPDATLVYSGHGPKTTIGREKASNPFIR